MQDKKNILIAILTSAVVWLAIETWVKPTTSVQNSTAQRVVAQKADFATLSPGLPIPATSQGEVIFFENEKISGSLDLKGGIIRQCSLKDYKETTDLKSDSVQMLSGDGTTYVAYFGWQTPAGSGIDLPTAETVWTSSGSALSPETPITLSWKNPQGVDFFMDLSLDAAYVIHVQQRVENNSAAAVLCTPTSTLLRQEPMDISSKSWMETTPGKRRMGKKYMMLHEGFIGITNGKLQEPSHSDISKLGQGPWMDLGSSSEKRGWLGLTDKYWLAAVIPAAGAKGCFTGQGTGFYTSQTQTPVETLAIGGKQSTLSHLFLGPKKLSLLEDYEAKLSIDHFDMAVDFGWFYFITKPMFNLLSALQKIVGNFGLSILIMTIAIKIIFFPLSSKSFRAMSRMRQLQPQIQNLKIRFKDDKLKLNEAMIALYKREKINPVSGCLPMLVQIPIFFSLYKVLFISIEMRHAPFWGWIQDLSAPDPTSLFSGFGLLPWSLPAWLHVGIWPILMGITMVGQQMMNASSITDSQQKIMLTYIMPVMFTLMLAQFPVGLVIYWTWSNFLTIAQQWFMMRYHKSVS